MEAKSYEKEKSQVREKWHLSDDAEVDFCEVITGSSCKHEFVHKTTQWAECINCHWGIQVGINDKIVDGHLYSNGLKVL